MELLFVILGGVALGALLRYTISGRHTHGSALLPGVGAIVAAAVWAALTWVGWSFDGTWIWVVCLVLAGSVCLGLALVLPRRREAHDVASYETLARASSASDHR